MKGKEKSEENIEIEEVELAPGTPLVKAKMYGLERPELPSTPLPNRPGGVGVDQESTSGDTEEKEDEGKKEEEEKKEQEEEDDVVRRLQKQVEDNEVTEQEQYALLVAKEAIMSSATPVQSTATHQGGKEERKRGQNWRKTWKKDETVKK